MSWPEVPLEKLAVEDAPIVYGILKPGPNTAGGVPYVRPSEMGEREIRLAEVLRTTHEIANQFRRSKLAAGDIVLSIVGTIGKVAFVPPELEGGNITQCSVRIRPQLQRVDPKYLSWALESPSVRRQYNALRFGSGVPRLNVGHVRALMIPLPPLPEQRRIADILDKADAVRRKRKEAIALTEELLRSAFLEMFGDPVTNPKGWPVVPMGDAILRFEAGWSASGEPRARTGAEYGVLKVSAVTSGYFCPEEHKAVSSGDVDRELITPRRGDLLFSRANTRDLVAACCLVEHDEPRLFLPDKLWRLVPEGKLATAEFLRFLLGHSGFRFELTKRATGTSGSMLNISMEKVRSIMMPAPPIGRQEQFSALVWRGYEMRSRQLSASRIVEELYDSLVHRAFRGGTQSVTRPKLAQLDMFCEAGEE